METIFFAERTLGRVDRDHQRFAGFLLFCTAVFEIEPLDGVVVPAFRNRAEVGVGV